MTKKEQREVIPCPECDGTGETEVDFHGITSILACEACRGTGEEIELIGEGLPKING